MVGPSPASPPWADMEFDLPASIPTMVSAEELRYLHWLGRDLWDGDSDVLEFGPWLGGSTYPLATGMAANPRRSDRRRLHVVDNFVWQQFMELIAPLGLAPGTSFRALFERNLADVSGLLEVHEARLPDEPIVDARFDWTLEERPDLPLFSDEMIPAPLGIVFIDGAKSWRGLAHMLAQIAARCVPGRTLLVFQDCKLAGGYWIQMGIARLDELDPGGLELTHLLPFNSVAFTLAPGAQPEAWGRLPATIDDIWSEDGLEIVSYTRSLFERAGDQDAARMVQVSEIVFLGSKRRWEEARARFMALDRARHSRREDPDLEHVRSWLERSSGQALPPPLRKRLAGAGHRLSSAISRRLPASLKGRV